MSDSNFELKDSGERRTFASGAIRDRGTLKPRPDLISPHAEEREGWILAHGAEKYAARNWEQGIPISECIASLSRHLKDYKKGLRDEDHMAQLRTNAGFILHYEEEIKAGRMDPAIDDMPKYATPTICPRCNAAMAPQFTAETGVEYFCDGCGLTSLDAWPSKQTEARIHRELEENAWKVPDTSMNYQPPKTPDPLLCACCKTRLSCPTERCAACGWCVFDCADADPHTRLPTFYVAGPMRGHKDLNFAAFDTARDRGIALGYKIISPADLDREHGIDPSKDSTVAEHENHLTPAELREIVARDIEVISTLKAEQGDGIAVLNGWGESIGATAEVALARWLELKIVWASDFHTLVED